VSRQINTRKRLSAADEQYLRDRGRNDLIEFANNRKEFEKQRNLTQEELADLQMQADTEARGKRTPMLMDNSLIEQQQEQRDDADAAQLEANSEEYDPDDVTFVESCTAEDLKRILKERGEPSSGTKPQLQRRLLDSLKKEAEQSEQSEQDGEQSEQNDEQDEQNDEQDEQNS
jgi:hypothetical protein